MFQVQGKCRSSRWRVLAERETHEEADQLYGKLRVEYGPEWMLLVVNKGDGGEGLTDMDFMLKFTGGLDGNNVSREQLRCLWTAWCLMHDVSPDTMEYDSILSRIWDEAPFQYFIPKQVLTSRCGGAILSSVLRDLILQKRMGGAS